jgi:hypothetical protein
MSEDKRILHVQIGNREDGKAVPAAQQQEANRKSIEELRQKAAELGIILPEGPLVGPDHNEDEEWAREIRAIAEPLMAPAGPSGRGEDAHTGEVLIGTRKKIRSVKFEASGRPAVTIQEETTEKGFLIGGHARGVGSVIQKFHEFGVKICVTVTDGVVRLFGRDRGPAGEKKPGKKKPGKKMPGKK